VTPLKANGGGPVDREVRVSLPALPAIIFGET
jgi:hypothetical protein